MTCGAFVTLPREEDVAELATSLAVGGKLLQRPAVPVGVGEEDELPPGVLLDATRLDPASRELGVRCGGVRYDDLRPRGADRRIGETGADRDRAGRARRRELHEAQLRIDGVVVVEVEPDALVELLRAVDVGHRYRNQLELPVHVLSFL